MGLNTPHRKKAIELFKTGSKSGFSIDATMDRFMAVCGRQNNLKRALLDYLVSLAIADGELHQAEQDVLRKIAGRLGFSSALFDKFIEMVKAQSQFKQSGGRVATGNQPLQASCRLPIRHWVLRRLSQMHSDQACLPQIDQRQSSR